MTTWAFDEGDEESKRWDGFNDKKNNGIEKLEIGADQIQNPIRKAIQNVNTKFIDFMDENTNVDDADDDDDPEFASISNKDWFG